eukprot:scaffold3253_cov180-Alexandrium_tamarense.AAC.3
MKRAKVAKARRAQRAPQHDDASIESLPQDESFSRLAGITLQQLPDRAMKVFQLSTPNAFAKGGHAEPSHVTNLLDGHNSILWTDLQNTPNYMLLSSK